MRVDLWSDVVCPWCAIGKAHLDQALSTFAEGQVLSDHDTLRRLATDSGLNVGDVQAVLSSDAYAELVRADEAEAARREITAVPTFLVDGRHVIPGAQSPESMLATLQRAWASAWARQDPARGQEARTAAARPATSIQAPS